MRRLGFQPFVLPKLFPMAVLVLGLCLTAYLGSTLQRSAYASWVRDAERGTQQQSSRIQSRINESLAVLSRLAAEVNNDEPGADAVFHDIVGRALGQGQAEFLSAQAWMLFHGGAWTARHAWAAPGLQAFFPAQGSAPNEPLLQTLTFARQTPDEWFMSVPFVDAEGKRRVYLVRVSHRAQESAVVAVFDLERFTDQLLAASSSHGLELNFLLEPWGSIAPVTLRAARQGGHFVRKYDNTFYLAHAELRMNWLVSDEYFGGADYAMANSVAVVGVVLSMLVALNIANLRNKNQAIQQRVDAATEDVKKAMAEAQASEKRLRHILDVSPVGIAITVDGIVQFANPALQTMLNVGLGGSMTERYVDPGARQRMVSALAENGHLYGVELQYYSAERQVRDYLVTFMRTDYGGKDAVLGWLLDITTLKQAEYMARVAQEAAEDATRAKSDFLANMSHEIRTPMNAIIGLSALAIRNDMPPRIRDYLRKIQRSGEHLLGIINEILDFSKIESGKLELESIPFELEAVIDNVVNLMEEKVREGNLELLCSVDPAIPRSLIGDPLRIGQILINYANNAVKFTPQGDICIRIRLQERSATSVTLHFSVRDTGIGLSEDQIRRLFNSFVQADTSTTRNYGGTGLGLAVSKRLAQAMGGDVGVSSQLGQGSTFWFTAQLGIGTEQLPQAIAAADLYGSRVLVVDDNPNSALIFSEMLAELGFAVQVVHSGPAALDAIAQADRQGPAFAFVVLDWLMPEMDGLETMRAMQALDLACQPRVLMVTAHMRQDLIHGAEALGIAHVLTKPVSNSLLVNTMMQIAGQAPAPLRPVAGAHEGSSLEASLKRIAGARVLLVEDNEINQQVACEWLRGAGLRVDVAGNGQVALDLLAAQQAQADAYDIVLMDMQMPVMDGVTASRCIRASQTAEQLPIVAMTANAMQADRQRCIDAGMNGYVTKPINPEELWKALLTWIKPRETVPPESVPDMGDPVDHSVDWIPALRRIDALDLDLGLQRTNHVPAFYVSMLRKFVASQAHAMDDIREALQRSDYQSMQLQAHTLKGVAGTLGASRLQAAAQKLELLLMQAAPDALLMVEVVNTTRQLTLLLQPLQQTLGPAQTVVRTAPQTLTPEQREHALDTAISLRDLLRADDARAIEWWDTHAAWIQLLPGPWEAVDSAIHGFAMEEALALLERAIPELRA